MSHPDANECNLGRDNFKIRQFVELNILMWQLSYFILAASATSYFNLAAKQTPDVPPSNKIFSWGSWNNHEITLYYTHPLQSQR